MRTTPWLPCATPYISLHALLTSSCTHILMLGFVFCNLQALGAVPLLMGYSSKWFSDLLAACLTYGTEPSAQEQLCKSLNLYQTYYCLQVSANCLSQTFSNYLLFIYMRAHPFTAKMGWFPILWSTTTSFTCRAHPPSFIDESVPRSMQNGHVMALCACIYWLALVYIVRPLSSSRCHILTAVNINCSSANSLFFFHYFFLSRLLRQLLSRDYCTWATRPSATCMWITDFFLSQLKVCTSL